ncbi:MAG: acyl carrier protein [Draconibacterium sp.]|nr:acyl carrier protein [Draconibacterium sp.]
MDELIQELKEKIIAQLNLEDIEPDEIDASQPLFGDGLGLDSIDALELIVLMERDYNIKITDTSEGRNIFSTITTMAEYITANSNRNI